MKRGVLLAAGAAMALSSAWAIAQDAPESLLPPGFDDPAPAPAAPRSATAPRAATPPKAAGSTAGSSSSAVSQTVSLPSSTGGGDSVAGSSGLDGAAGSAPTQAARLDALKKLSLDQLAKMTPEELEDALGLEPSYDIPAAQRRSLEKIGILAEDEGGLAHSALVGQDGKLVRAALAGNGGRLVSRWGHILLRRALASRLDAPSGMKPVEFAALRAALLVRMGEGDAARALVQDVDAGNYNDALSDAALDAYTLTADFTGVCPVALGQAASRKEPKWEVAQNICRAFRGEATYAIRQLDRATANGVMPRIDMLLAQRYAGAAGKARRNVTIEWDGVNDMTPWRYGLTLAVGLEPPAKLTSSPRFDYMAATAPMLGLGRRVEAADNAAAAGILSGSAMVDLYSQVYSDAGTGGDWAGRAEKLREAYVARDPAARLAAMQDLWNGAPNPDARHARQVLTAFAAARMPVSSDMSDQAGALIASMLTAGLDRNAMKWSSVVDAGSEGWALLALASPDGNSIVESGDLDSFVDDDGSTDSRKSAFLVAGLAGLGRINAGTRDNFASRLELDFTRETRWSRLIDQAAEVRNPGLVAYLAGVGMQGSGWDKMTARHLFHIVSALNRVGLGAEARMIAAEAVARG